MLVMCERWDRDGERDCHILTPSSSDHSSTSSSFCWAAQPGSLRAQALCLELVLTPRASYLQLEQQLQLQLSTSDSNWTQTVCGTWLYNCLTSNCFLWASHLHRIQPVHRSRWNSDIFDRMHLFLDWRLGQRSVCYKMFDFYYHITHTYYSCAYCVLLHWYK